jgi:hypothetical protein
MARVKPEMAAIGISGLTVTSTFPIAGTIVSVGLGGAAPSARDTF